MLEENIFERLFGGLMGGNEEETTETTTEETTQETPTQIPQPEEEHIEKIPLLQRYKEGTEKITMVIPKYRIVYSPTDPDELTTMATNGKILSWEDIIATNIALVFANSQVYVVVENEGNMISIPTGVMAQILKYVKAIAGEHERPPYGASIDNVMVSTPKSGKCFKPLGPAPIEVWIAPEGYGATIILKSKEGIVGLAPEDINYIVDQLIIATTERDIEEPLAECGIEL